MKSVRRQLRELNRAAKGGEAYAEAIEAELRSLDKRITKLAALVGQIDLVVTRLVEEWRARDKR